MIEELEAMGLTEDVRKQLVEYYKWIVTLATFVLTVSLSFVAILGQTTLTHRVLLMTGWLFLALCIFLNWLIVKRLVAIPIFAAVAAEDEGKRHRVFKSAIRRIRVYGTVQNGGFLLGVLCVGVALALNVG